MDITLGEPCRHGFPPRASGALRLLSSLLFGVSPLNQARRIDLLGFNRLPSSKNDRTAIHVMPFTAILEDLEEFYENRSGQILKHLLFFPTRRLKILRLGSTWDDEPCVSFFLG